MAVSQQERQQRTQPGRVARGAQSTAKRRLEARRSCLSEARRGGPTFCRRRALSIRGFRARFLRSIISGGLQGRLWNIHNEPLRTAAAPHPSFRLQEEMGSSVFRSRKPPSAGPRWMGRGHVIKSQGGPIPPHPDTTVSPQQGHQAKMQVLVPGQEEKLPFNQPAVSAETRPHADKRAADTTKPAAVSFLTERLMGERNPSSATSRTPGNPVRSNSFL